MYIYTLAIDNAGPYAIKPHSVCRRIEARENTNSSNPPTADLNQFDESDASGTRGARIPKGTSAIFTRPNSGYTPSDTAAGYINTASGSCTLTIIEDDAI